MVSTAVGVAFALGLVAHANATTITVLNGDFESSVVESVYGFPTYGTSSGSLTGWTIAGSIDHIRSYWTPESGAQSLDMSGNEAGTISQSLYIPFAGTAHVSFWMAGNPDDSDKTKLLKVSLSGAETYSFDTTGHSSGAMGWVNHVADFTVGGAGNYTLSFSSLNNSAWGPALDNVSASIPDGGLTLMLLGMALGGLGYARRMVK